MDACLRDIEFSDTVHLNGTYSPHWSALSTSTTIFFFRNDNDIGCITSEMHHIHLTTNVPIRSAPYRCSEADGVEMHGQNEDFLKQGLIRLATSRYAVQALLAEKKREGRTGFYSDYRKLNAGTAPDCQPVPSIDDILDSKEIDVPLNIIYKVRSLAHDDAQGIHSNNSTCDT